MSDLDFLFSTFVSALETFKEGGLSSFFEKRSTAVPQVIYTKTHLPDTNPEKDRTYSMVSQRNVKDGDGLIGSIKGLFNK
jgi:hypothetical protein